MNIRSIVRRPGQAQILDCSAPVGRPGIGAGIDKDSISAHSLVVRIGVGCGQSCFLEADIPAGCPDYLLGGSRTSAQAELRP